MSEVLTLKREEWLSLVVVTLALILAFFALQRYSPKPAPIYGQPHFEFTIGEDELKNPLAVAVYKDVIAVASSDEGAVKIYSSDGKLMKSIKIAAGAYPSSLAFSDNGTLYIGDLANKMIYKSNVLLNPKPEKLKLKKSVRPQALGILNDKLFVFDGVTQKLKLIDNSLKAVDFIKDKSFRLSYANGVYGAGDKLYVSDSNGRRVLKLDSDGGYLGTLKNFSLPRGIAVDSLNRLHVVDTFAHTVKVFGPDGNFLFNYGSEGNAEDQLYFPNGLAINSVKGKIYITDKGNNRLQVWSW